MKSTELVKYRKQHKLSQYDVAKMLKVSRGAVAHWEQAEELSERVALWLEMRKERFLKKAGTYSVQEDNVFRLSAEAEKLLKDRGRTKSNTPDPAYSKETNKKVDLSKVVALNGCQAVSGVTDEDFFIPETRGVAPILNKDNAQVATAIKEVVEKSLFEQKLASLQLDERVDTLIEELRKVVVDTVKRILGV